MAMLQGLQNNLARYFNFNPAEEYDVSDQTESMEDYIARVRAEGGTLSFSNLPGKGYDTHTIREQPIPRPAGMTPELVRKAVENTGVDPYQPFDYNTGTEQEFVDSQIRKREVEAGLQNELLLQREKALRATQPKMLPFAQQAMLERIKNSPKLIDNLMQRIAETPDPEQKRVLWEAVQNELGYKKEPIQSLPPPPEKPGPEKPGGDGTSMKKVADIVKFITPDADLNVTAKRFIDKAKEKGITMKSLGFSLDSLEDYGTFAKWLNEYLINRPVRALNQALGGSPEAIIKELLVK